MASSLNWRAGATLANAVTSRVGSNGTVQIYNHVGSADVIADLNGWFD